MNLRKFLIPILSLFFVVLSCDDDDDDAVAAEIRDSQEVADENDVDILEYFETHYFNYEDFDFTDANNPSNNEFTVVLDTISSENATEDKIPLSFYLENPSDSYPKLYVKTVTEDDIDYSLYILKVREGEGDTINALDAAAMLYVGIVPDGTIFDSQVNIGSGQPFNLTGVVSGFREGIIEFKTRTGFENNPDGSITNIDHGIGAIFMPSGLGYFASPTSSSIPQYSPLFFNLEVISRSNTDFDGDGIPSHIEHPDGDVSDDDDDTDEDLLQNYIDTDDDGDGVLTEDEVQQNEYEDDGTNQFTTKAEAQAYFSTVAAADPEEVFISIEAEFDGTFTLHTLVIPDDDSDGIPNYLDSSVTTELE